uniref:Uncharacterized protein n=1 Tax=Heterorhabditis bacteriophora TaxID=37862 RepID=A0A1I7WBI9_HETBA
MTYKVFSFELGKKYMIKNKNITSKISYKYYYKDSIYGTTNYILVVLLLEKGVFNILSMLYLLKILVFKIYVYILRIYYVISYVDCRKCDKFGIPGIRHLIDHGIHSEYLRSVFPTQRLYTENHGMTSDYMWDIDTQLSFERGKGPNDTDDLWWDGRPASLWYTAGKAGVDVHCYWFAYKQQPELFKHHIFTQMFLLRYAGARNFLFIYFIEFFICETLCFPKCLFLLKRVA